jgi:ferredoxin
MIARRSIFDLNGKRPKSAAARRGTLRICIDMSTPKRVLMRIDPDKCQGHNRCKAILSELIDLDAYGNAQPKGDGTVPAELLERAYLAKSNCPEFALEIIEE